MMNLVATQLRRYNISAVR